MGEGREGKQNPGLCLRDDFNGDTQTSAGLKAPAAGRAEWAHSAVGQEIKKTGVGASNWEEF